MGFLRGCVIPGCMVNSDFSRKKIFLTYFFYLIVRPSKLMYLLYQKHPVKNCLSELNVYKYQLDCIFYYTVVCRISS